MEIRAKLNHLRIAPRKTRMVIDMIRGKSVEEAQAVLNFTVKRGNEPVLKLLKSAIAAARNNFQIEESNLYIASISVDEGAILKRSRPRSRGRAFSIKKRTSHINLTLKEIKEGEGKVKKSKKTGKISSKEKVEKREVAKIKKTEKFVHPVKKEPKGLKASSAPSTKIFRRKSI